LNTGETGSCHRASGSYINDLNNFHNTETKILARQQMLAGEWPGGGCEYCKNIESAGGTSDRQFQNQIPEIYPLELDSDPTATVVDPVILEVFFSNTCNLRCVYCSAECSSGIQQEDKRFGGSIIAEQNFEYQDNRYKELVPQFWQWMTANGHKLKRLQVLGGEPFLQDDVDQLIAYFEKTPCPDLEFNLVTNLMIPSRLLQNKLQQLASLLERQHLKRVDLQCSVDRWGPAQEYVRYGFDRTVFENNLRMVQDFGVFRTGLLTTVNALSINEMPQLATKFLEWNQHSVIYWYMHLVLPEGTSIFDPMNFEYQMFSSSLDQVAELIPQDTWDNRQTLQIFDGIRNKLMKGCQPNSTKQDQLCAYLDQNDIRRRLDWKKTFPDLLKELSHVV
jgi:organic radical activating enzyme